MDFSGTLLRTVMATGMVSVEDFGPLEGVEITISGGLKGLTHTATTDADGMYEVGRLYAGTYAVTMTNPNDDEYGFDTPMVDGEMVELRETLEVDFSGILLRTVVIRGTVSLRDEDGGAPLPNVAVTISGGPKDEEFPLETRNDGTYRVDRLHAGEYSVEIMNPDADEYEFDRTTRTVEVDLKETGTADFSVTLLRTVTATGMVTVEDFGPLENVEITISGGLKGLTHTATTDADGMYSVDRLYAGEYSVTMANPNDDEYGEFNMPDDETVELREKLEVDFSGILLRTAVIAGEVTVGDDDTPLSGVTLTVSGGPKDESRDATTNADGKYEVDRLHQGEYTVSLKDFNRVEYGFSPESVGGVDAMRKETETVNFQGIYLRTAGVSGSVTVGGMGIDANVALSMKDEDGEYQDVDDMDTQGGQFGFSGLAEGDYMLTLSGYDAVEYVFEDNRPFSLDLDESRIENFRGMALRTAHIMGNVSDEDGGIEGVAVTLIRVLSGNTGEQLNPVFTDKDGNYMSVPLLAGAYQVMISGDALTDEHDFESTGGTTRPAVATTAENTTLDFEATFFRESGVSGKVTVDDVEEAGITVTLTGDHAPDDDTNPQTTGEDGLYGWDGLRAGNYTVTISGFNEDKYSFPTTARGINLAVKQTQDGVSFNGSRLAQSSISGQVAAEYDDGSRTPLQKVMVELSGDDTGSQETDANGEYNFPGLAGGSYTVTITNPNADAYEFPDGMEADVTLGDDDAAVEDFIGEHRNNGSISGVLFLDEGADEGVHHADEPLLTLPADALPEGVTGIPMLLQGPTIDKVTPMMANGDGTYEFAGLEAGDYRLLLDLDTKFMEDGPNAAAVLTAAGYRFDGELTGQAVQVEAAKGSTANFPFRITMQTIHVGAVMGTSKMATETMVGGVELMLFATVEAADVGTKTVEGYLGTAKTGADDTKANFGMAQFDFARAMDLGPGGQGKDHLVFAKVVKSNNAALEVADNSHIEIQYNATDRVSSAPAAARLLNTAVAFQWWVKSKSGVPNGDRLLGGWNAVVGTDTIATADSAAADPTMRAAAADHGKGSFTTTVAIADLDDKAQAKYTVKLDQDRAGPPAYDAPQPDGGEKWSPSGTLTHTHNALQLPPKETADLTAIEVTWTTQSLVVGVYRERDDVPGYIGHTSHREEDDQRPVARVAAEMGVEVMIRGDRNRLEKYEWFDHDNDPKTDPIHPTLSISNGLVTARHLPATKELTVRLDVGLNRVSVTEPQEYVETFGTDLTLGTTLGAFGGMSGGGPEVRLCTASIGTSSDDGDCATFGYQWTTGSVTGSTSPAVRGLPVTLEAVTDNHGARDQAGTTNAAGSKSFNVRDGTYDISASADNNPNWAIISQKTHRRWCYHDEKADETNEPRADSAWVGRACFDPDPSASWTLSRRGLEIRGFVANVDHEFNRVVRGDETYAGAQLTATGPGGSFNATVGSDGLYRFTGLQQGSYTITAVNGADHEMLRYGPDSITVRNVAASHEYVAVDEQNATLNMPFWDYVNSTGTSTETATPLNDAVTVGSGSSAVNMNFYNFALLHKDGTFSGKVTAKGPGSDPSRGIAVELKRCLVYTAFDDNDTPSDFTDDTPESCTTDPSFAPRVQQTGSGGVWSFGDLREGYYQVNIAGPGYLRAKLSGTPMTIDDDGANCGSAADAATCDRERTVRKFDLLKGDDAFNSNAINYYVYDGNLSRDDELSAASVMGVTTIGGDAVQLNGNFVFPALGAQNAAGTDALGATSAAIMYGDNGGAITINVTAAGRSAGSSYVIQKGSGATATMHAPGATGATVTLDRDRTPAAGGPDAPANATKTTNLTIWVTGANGYDDHAYTFTADRTNPVGNELVTGEISDAAGNNAGGAGTTASPYTLATPTGQSSVVVNFTMVSLGAGVNVRCAQSVAVFAPGATTATPQIADQDAVLCTKHYNLSAGTNGTTYRVQMTSEDGRTRNYWLNIT